MTDLYGLTAGEAVNRITRKTISVKDYVSSCLMHLRSLEPSIHAWVCVDESLALTQAEAIDMNITKGKTPGTLAGLPIGIKDIFNTTHFPTQMGSQVWKGFTPGNNARVVDALLWEDAVIPGKTVTAEFAVHTPGPTHNPFRWGYMTGTSSSGSAAAVASQMVPLAIGTQTAGSTIRPASYCGVYGMKPSFGLIPRTGMLKTTDSLDQVGFFSRSAFDLRLLFEVLRVKGENHPISDKALRQSALSSQKKRRWRIGLITSSLWVWEKAEDYAQAAIKEFGQKLERDPRLTVVNLELPKIFNTVHSLHNLIYNKTLAYYFDKEYRQKKLVSQIMRELIEIGQKTNLEEYLRAISDQERIGKALDRLFVDEKLDAILTLSTGGEALKGLSSVDRPDSCLIWTFCQIPAVSLPVFRGPLNLPFGAQIVARKYDDYRLLQLAEYLETQHYVSYSPPTASRN